MNNPVIYSYKGSEISFMSGESTMINATQMAKPFGKRTNDWLSLKQTNELICSLSTKTGIPATGLVTVNQGGSNPGTWLYEDLALIFAQWLSPDFYLWCNDRIKELLKYGMTATHPTLEQMLSNPDLVISLATQLKTERAEKNRIQSELIEQKVLIEQKKEEISMKDERLTVLTPKGETYDKIMSSQGLVTTNMIAAFLGMSAAKLNKLLCEWGVQYKQSSTYFLVSKYRGKGLAKHIPYPYMDNGVQKSREHMYWTEAGRKFVIDLYNSKVAA